MTNLGLEYGKDYIFLTDLINSIDNDIPKKIIVFGTGKIAEKLTESCMDFEVAYYVDNDSNKWGTLFNDKLVKEPNSILNEKKGDFAVFIASTTYDYEIKNQLIEMGAVEPGHIYSYNEIRILGNSISRHLLQTIKAPVLYDRVCGNMFNVLHISSHGLLSICTPWSKEFHPGNILYRSYDEIINSPLARLIRLSAINGTYCFCTQGCPNNRFCWKNNDIEKCENETFSYKHETLYVDGYHTIALNHDPTCNLSCPSCRNKPLVLNECQKRDIEIIHQKIVNEVLPPTSWLTVAGNGDPFFSKYYREIIFEKYKGERLTLQTNGLLFNRRSWEKLSGRYKYIDLQVSIDAATKETYSHVRRGGNFDTLMENMEFAKELHDRGDIDHFRIIFVVQSCNFREMESFVEMGLRLNVDLIAFMPIYNWTGATEEEYTKLNLRDERNKDHAEFMEILKKPIFQHEKVAWGFALKEE